MLDYNNKKVMVVGMARSGIAMAKLLLDIGARVVIYDAKQPEQLNLDGLEACENACGKDAMSFMLEADVLALSPGVPTRLPFIKRAVELGKPVIAEIELGWQAAPASYVCITGTNGKTTTTALVGEMFKNSGRRTHVLGNIGVPICDKVKDILPDDVVVAETAALQLETIDKFRPCAGAFLNLTEDHMDRFLTMDNYARCKMRLFENQTKENFAVLNMDDPEVCLRSKEISSTKLWFSTQAEVQEGAFLRGENIIYRYGGIENSLCSVSDVLIPGIHNLQNALAGICLASCMGVSVEAIVHTLKTFPGVEHRIEFVREIAGIRFINDSKGTNPDATMKAVQAMTRPTVLILGGYDKQSEFTSLFECLKPTVRSVVLLGQTQQKLENAAKEANFSDVELADTFDDAVLKARAIASDGMNVLLSPACASWDMFEDFEKRGERFKRIVRELK